MTLLKNSDRWEAIPAPGGFVTRRWDAGLQTRRERGFKWGIARVFQQSLP